ncbi:hypothetical protein PFICI_04326 [Pestalotiopsis fici W106-1]|uniref:Rhodopsin domain-containing protein n=1 Tax=Pestalotiopsis fici (strain W106-1 / CGMCC3.15140) TaxID=1229662 RepID=W3X8T1_PESFW|nr:uncharacterized protein PFICI_04326 [Pestalotiopsis fici W106-1]ETS82450.1 hypothetical protein PFICI_04326 [Pestalotiopsis fici W106-1]
MASTERFFHCNIQDSGQSWCERNLASRSSMDQTMSVQHLSEAIIAIMTTIFVMRCIERISSHHWGKDDSTLSVAVVAIVCGTSLGFALSSHGLGRDAWDLPDSDVSMVRLLIYCAEFFYGVSITLIRLSALFFYLRIFPQTPFKFYVYAMITFDILFGVAYNAVFIFQCWPINSIWAASNVASDATCVDIHQLALSGSVINMLQDLMVVVLPTPILVKLSLPISSKIQVFFMFSLGML